MTSIGQYPSNEYLDLLVEGLIVSMVQEEKDYYHRLILDDHKAARRQLAELEKQDHAHFVELCHQLLFDPSTAVQNVGFLCLGQYGDSNDQVVETRALEALGNPEIRRRALFALGRVATPTALPVLFTYAQAGIPEALEALRRLVTTQDEKQRLLELARQYLLSPDYPLREEALNVLLKRSSAAAEEELLIAAVRMYYDELFIQALGKATVRAMPALEELLTTVRPDTAEHHDISRALEKLKKQTATTSEEERLP